MYKLELTARAKADFDEASERYAADSERNAQHFVKRVETILARLQKAPLEFGPYMHSKTLRRCFAKPFPYVVIFEMIGEIVLVHTVRHSRRRPFRKPRRP